jgi:hypothetical protein
VATTFDRAVPSEARSHRYYLAMALGFLVLVLVAFTGRYYDRLAGIEAATPIVHLHAASFSAWFVLLLAQASLVGAGRADLHRRLGIAAFVLVPAIVAVGLATAVQAARSGWNPGGVSTPLGFLALGIADTVLYGAFAAAAIWQRRKPETHKRLMMLANVSLLWAAVTRLPPDAGVSAPSALAFAGVLLLFVLLALAGPIYDYVTRRRVHPFEVAGGVLIIAAKPLSRLLSGTEAWQRIGGWLIG